MGIEERHVPAFRETVMCKEQEDFVCIVPLRQVKQIRNGLSNT